MFPEIYSIFTLLLIVTVFLIQVIPSWRAYVYVDEDGGRLKPPKLVIILLLLYIAFVTGLPVIIYNTINRAL
jgi:hypothetical protein